MRFNLGLWFAVCTKEMVNDSQLVFTKRASTDWHFDGDHAQNPIWSLTGTGNGDVNAFIQVNDGLPVPIIGGTPINDLILGETFYPPAPITP